MKLTSNYELKKPEVSDAVNIDDLNYNTDIVDVKLKEAIEKANQAFQSASNGKSIIAGAITGKGVPTSANDTFTVMASNIDSIVTDPSIGTTDATASDVLAPKKVVSQGNLLTGTMPNRGAVNQNLTTEGQEYTIPSGYHNGLGKVKAVITGLVASAIKAGTTVGGILGTFTSDATATTAQMLAGAVAYVNGNKITGTIPSKTAQTYTPGTSNQTIATGQYLSGAQTIAGSANLVAANIKSGVNIFGVVGNVAPAQSPDNASVPVRLYYSSYNYYIAPISFVEYNDLVVNSVVNISDEFFMIPFNVADIQITASQQIKAGLSTGNFSLTNGTIFNITFTSYSCVLVYNPYKVNVQIKITNLNNMQITTLRVGSLIK